jgi:LPXTG-motif cell wall-anchored protein
MAGMRIRMSDRTSVVGIGVILLGMLLVVVGVFLPSSAHATQPNPEHKVTLCHATHSYSNPYVVINVDIASVLFHGHDGHDGPVFYAEIPKHHKWGDIIPPFNYGPGKQYAGKNWSEGQAIWNADCQSTPSTPTTTGSTTIPSSTTTTTSSTATSTIAKGRATIPTSSVNVEGEAITKSSTTVAAAHRESLPATGSDAVPLSFTGLAMIATGLALVLSRRRNAAM